ncbi:hypothetical protein BCY76_010880 [Nesterenkonia sp. PF2B19]|nr:hypothetical protein BCY76_010880 [Nesterenkonia sp. PF2B19]
MSSFEDDVLVPHCAPVSDDASSLHPRVAGGMAAEVDGGLLRQPRWEHRPRSWAAVVWDTQVPGVSRTSAEAAIRWRRSGAVSSTRVRVA